jgi:hypothetical protein
MKITKAIIEIINGKWVLNKLTYTECSKEEKSIFNRFFKYIHNKQIKNKQTK